MQSEQVQIKFQLRLSSRAGRGDDRSPMTVIEPQSGKQPRIVEVLALAIQFEEMVRSGEVSNYADLARLGGVSRERLSQIMKLRWLAPDIQSEILQLARTPGGRFPVCETMLRRVAEEPSWAEQKRRWRESRNAFASAASHLGESAKTPPMER